MLPCFASSGQKVEIALGRVHDRRIGGAERQIPVLGDEFSDVHPVTWMHVLCEEVPGCVVFEEPNLSVCAEASSDEIGDFGDDKCRDDERPRMGLEQVKACGVMAVVSVDVCVERSGIDDQSDGCTSAARISSMRE